MYFRAKRFAELELGEEINEMFEHLWNKRKTYESIRLFVLNRND